MQAEAWSFDAGRSAGELASFIAQMIPAGAIGFRYFALRSGMRPGTTGDTFHASAARRAALLALLFTLYRAWGIIGGLPAQAARRKLDAMGLLTSDIGTALSVLCVVLAVVGFALAWRGVRAGWPLAAFGVVVSPFRSLLTGRLGGIVNPAHVLFAGLWIGTLFVLVVIGLAPLMRAEARERRGALAADMVRGFSPLALASGGMVVLFGLITAWTHLGAVDALWTTPYGVMLIRKLIFVAAVFGLGAWNWKRQGPTLGSDEAARSIRKSSITELTVAFVVLLLTSVLVTMPAPAEKGGSPPGGPPPGGAPASTAPGP
ncbi:MAG: copper resistance domain protein [Gemmatimonadetes bacterium]|nr:copper resistance domain protein [Gemmatimonadota bacterium]